MTSLLAHNLANPCLDCELKVKVAIVLAMFLATYTIALLILPM